MNLTPEQIIAAVEEHGSIRRAAPSLGCDERTVRRAVRGLGIEDEVAAARQRHRLRPPSEADRPAIDDPERLKAARLEAELRMLRREVRQYEEALASREATIERIIEAARVPVTVPSYKVADPDPTLPERSIVLPIFDLQYGQFVRPEDVPFGKGGFTEAIFDARLAAYVEKVCAFLRDRAASTRFTELHIVLGGDLVEGSDIFAGQAWQLHSDPVRQTLDLRVKLASALRRIVGFAKEVLGVETIAAYGVPGNHGKVGGKRAGATPSTASWDYLLVELLRDDLRAEPIDLFVNEPAGALLFETQGHTFLVVHGDEIKGHSGIPFYGLTRFDGRAMRLAETVYDYCLLGHHHQPASIPNGSGGEFIVSGDWVGGNNLSKWIVAASRPQQRILLVGQKYGVATDERIYFDDRSTRRRPKVYKAAQRSRAA